jgi:hypothetical protein
MSQEETGTILPEMLINQTPFTPDEAASSPPLEIQQVDRPYIPSIETSLPPEVRESTTTAISYSSATPSGNFGPDSIHESKELIHTMDTMPFHILIMSTSYSTNPS